MLTGISWNNYMVVVVLLSIVWYLFVGLRYYFDDIKDLVSGKRKLQFRGLERKLIPKSDYDFDYQKSDEILKTSVEFETIDPVFNEVEEFTASLKKAITDAIQKKLIKKDFEDHLRFILKEHPLLGNSPLRSSINELIVSECEKQESVLLTHQEVDALWNLKNL
ncbi:MAG: hypothetical protein B7Y83_01115 [Flavobacteriales bacterium 32-34-25]|nr:MAG: hypothetical protein B7Y83_01115 [Flavobacteriales bacterium 32-34-25]